MAQHEKADVVVVGAGPAGSTAAALLAERGVDVLLVDRAHFPRDKTCGDGLTPRALPVLERLGLLPVLEQRGYQRVLGARLFPTGGAPWTMRFAEHDLGLAHYGLVVPRYELDELLLRRAEAGGARFLPGFNAERPVWSDNGGAVRGIRGTLAGGEVSVDAPLTVFAVGANVGLLRAAGVLERMPPGINAVRGYFTGVPALEPYFEFYFERELAPGYAWVFPLADGRANVGLGVWGGRDARGRVATDARTPHRLLQEFVGRSPRLRAARPASDFKGFPLRIDYPRYRPVGPGYLLVGEALGLVNPVTGEGIDLALESAELAATFVAARLGGGPMDGALRGYERALHARFAGFFRGVQLLLRLATGPRAISVLVRQAQKKPRLARLIAGINLGVASPWRAFSPLTWWDLLT